MGMLDEYNRNEDVRKLKAYIDGFAGFLQQIDDRLGLVQAMITKYPSDATELNALLSAAKSQMQGVIAKY
jgi:hypothetical protein